MEPRHEVPPPAAILQLVTNMWASRSAACLASLGVPDELAHGPKTAGELAAAVGANEGALYRLLRAMVGVGLVWQDGTTFALTPVGECLRSDVPGSMRSLLIAEMAPGHWLPWGVMEHAVRTGKPATEHALGTDAWSYYAQHPEEGDHFARGMSGLSGMATQAVLSAYSFDTKTTIVDVGGSHGAFLAAVLQRVPTARGVLFDLPHVVEGAAQELADARVLARIERVGGSFFEAVPAGGDAYLLKHILHDWSDDECVQILTRVREAMAPNASTIVVEMVIAPDGPPSPAPLLDLNMLVMLTGRERTVDEFGGLFARAGLRLNRVVPTHSPFVILEASAA